MNAPHQFPPLDRWTIARAMRDARAIGNPRFDGPAVHQRISNPDDSRTYREVVAVVAMLAALPWLALAIIWWLS